MTRFSERVTGEQGSLQALGPEQAQRIRKIWAREVEKEPSRKNAWKECL